MARGFGLRPIFFCCIGCRFPRSRAGPRPAVHHLSSEGPMANLQQLIEQYLDGPKQLRAAVAGMSREQVTARPIAGKWSTLEVVAHLTDFDPIYADRMKRVLAED